MPGCFLGLAAGSKVDEAKSADGKTLVCPIFFKFQNLTIYSYGFCVALAVMLVLVISSRLAPRKQLLFSTAMDLIFVSFVSGIVGARLFYVAQHRGDYESSLVSIFWIQEGGLVWYGGFIFAVLAGAIYCRWHHLSAWEWTDFFAPILPLAHGIGRIGCFLNGCCYGREMNFFFDRHPTQLYEAFGLFVIASFLFLRVSKENRVGKITAEYLFLYSTLRFFIEFLRDDSFLIYFLTFPQWISLGIFLLTIFFLKMPTFHENKH